MPVLAGISEVVERATELRRSKPGTVLVAIDGAGGAGKSSLAASIVQQIDNAYVISLDDFARPSVPGWDQERFRRQVLDLLLAGQDAYYQRWDWPTDSGAEWHRIPRNSIVIVEGVSSTRTELGNPWDLTIWIETPRSIRLARGVTRDGEAMRSQWTDVWMPEEDAYIAAQHPEQRADLVVNGYTSD
ncbi:MAG: uridine kinase [Actinobacteria bacterium]|nr:uridine kinase [Actinomycetota bacterium]